MRVVVAPGGFDGTPAAAAEAIAAGWRRAAPADDLVLVDAVDAGLTGALDRAGLVITGEESFDWRSLRGTPVAAVAEAAAARGVPCVVLARHVLAGRREAAAIGVDAAYAIAGDGTLADLAEKIARQWSR